MKKAFHSAAISLSLSLLLACANGADEGPTDLGSSTIPPTLEVHSSTTSTTPRGIRVEMEAEGFAPAEADVSCQDLNSAKSIIEARARQFGVVGTSVDVAECNRMIVVLPNVSAEQARDFMRPGVLMFCKPLPQEGAGVASGTIGSVQGRVVYKPGTCDPQVAPDGTVSVETSGGKHQQEDPIFTDVRTHFMANAGVESIIWSPGMESAGRTERQIDHSDVIFDAVNEPLLVLELADDAREPFGAMTERMIGLPLAFFFDGEPMRDAGGSIIAPIVQSRIDQTVFIVGLSLDDAERFRTFLNHGALPIPMRIVRMEEF